MVKMMIIMVVVVVDVMMMIMIHIIMTMFNIVIFLQSESIVVSNYCDYSNDDGGSCCGLNDGRGV